VRAPLLNDLHLSSPASNISLTMFTGAIHFCVERLPLSLAEKSGSIVIDGGKALARSHHVASVHWLTSNRRLK
jgi:hypothetical protein